MKEFHAKTVAHKDRRLNKASKTRIFIWPRKETIVENMVNRRNRPVKDWKPIAVKAAQLFDVRFDDISWSQNAGCSCGCTPGFIVKGPHRPGFDIHVDI